MLHFKDILGQAAALDWLSAAYRADRLPHGLVFAGPPGVGKGTAARALAALHLCHRPAGVEACGGCDSCRLLGAQTHPDYHVVYRQLVRQIKEKENHKARDLSIYVIQDFLIAPAGLKAALGHGKVFVIEEAETMNAAAQNALLKTLEEPPARTLIILLSDAPESLLPTIRSRTQLVRFHALDDAVVIKGLVERGIDKGTAEQAALLAEGSLGTAIKWIADGVVGAAGELRKIVEPILAGRPPGGDLAEWFKAASDAHAKRQTERDPDASLDQAKREAISLYLRVAAQRFRQHLREAEDAGSLDRSCAALETIARVDGYLDANVNTSILLQQLAQTLGRLGD